MSTPCNFHNIPLSQKPLINQHEEYFSIKNHYFILSPEVNQIGNNGKQFNANRQTLLRSLNLFVTYITIVQWKLGPKLMLEHLQAKNTTFLHVLGPLKWLCASTLGAALLCSFRARSNINISISKYFTEILSFTKHTNVYMKNNLVQSDIWWQLGLSSFRWVFSKNVIHTFIGRLSLEMLVPRDYLKKQFSSFTLTAHTKKQSKKFLSIFLSNFSFLKCPTVRKVFLRSKKTFPLSFSLRDFQFPFGYRVVL